MQHNKKFKSGPPPMFWMLVVFLPVVLCAEVIYAQPRPRELTSQYNRAEVAWRTGGSMLEAKARVDRVIEALPDDLQALKLRAQILIAMERPKEAVQDVGHVISLAPDDGEAYVILSEASRLMGDTTATADAILRARELVDNVAALHIRLARSAASIGDLQTAEESSRAAFYLAPRDATACYQLVTVLVAAQKTDEAAGVVARALRDSILDVSVLRPDGPLSQLRSHPILAEFVN